MTKSLENIVLESSDIFAMQADLCAALKRLCPFDGHTLYFPKSVENVTPQFLPREHKLILPLFFRERFLGVLVLNKVINKKAHPLLPYLAGILELCLENLARSRALRLDAETGLYVERELYARILEESAIVTAPENASCPLANLPAYRLCLGLVIVRLRNDEELALRCGHLFVQDLTKRLAERLKASVSSDMLCVRLGRCEFAVLTQTTGREKCRKLAEDLLDSLKQVTAVNPLTEQAVYPVLSAGYAYYPHDMRHEEMQLVMEEQAQILRQRVALACEVAAPGRCLGFSQILKSGGRIVELLPLGRFRLNLGRQMGIVPGKRFAVFSVGESHSYKGDLLVVQARKKTAVAELCYQETAGILPNAGDVLEIVSDSLLSEEKASDAAEELATSRAFAQKLAALSHAESVFTLVLLHLEKAKDQPQDACFAKAKTLLERTFGKKTQDSAITIARHGPKTLEIFHPALTAEQLVADYRDITKNLSAEGIECAAGLCSYPYLSLHKGDVPACAVKALEYARLLPEPRVGICDSLAFTISADKRYSFGDLFGALEEYKMALLADADNDMAWNSMGVCMAALGRKEEARRHFLEALARSQDAEQSAQILYNLGTISQSLGEDDKAMEYFERCVQEQPSHLYAIIRLGELYEHAGRKNEAKGRYEQAAALEDAGKPGSNLALRHLAGLASRQDLGDTARSILQEALQHNPGDAAAMLMLARIYLDCGEDPSLAEALARRSCTLQDRPEAWQTLARALRLLGQEERACQADARALLAQERLQKVAL
ncbi:MAG: tetratricopeptide repeat protein [Desulfovibrio sp.]|nr:tetratricopeptide repeat protein [Desulfovibrio sp.]